MRHRDDAYMDTMGSAYKVRNNYKNNKERTIAYGIGKHYESNDRNDRAKNDRARTI
ncbi:hypothetical protein [Anaerosporobacter sp.]|uniref:hypothetical protein n=1 Tax=Anaerosporobacter sp. TaxID=1872529 RepID=UPI00286EBD4D|nr:hypothetical protein [Anaerosporobacter sp.]